MNKSKLCTAYAQEILDFHSVNISQDTETKHSKFICVKCYTILIKLNRSRHDQPSVTTRENAAETSRKSAHLWCGFDSDPAAVSIDHCSSCRHFEQQKRSGKRPAKRKLRSEKQELDSCDRSFDSTASLSAPVSTSTPTLKRYTLER